MLLFGTFEFFSLKFVIDYIARLSLKCRKKKNRLTKMFVFSLGLILFTTYEHILVTCTREFVLYDRYLSISLF